MAYILAIDDELSQLRHIRSMLTELGHTVDVAESPLRARELLSRGKEAYQAIICDNFMGEENAGIALLQNLRENKFTQEMILYTSNFRADLSGFDLERLRLHYVQKDIFGDTLKEKIIEILQ